MKNQWDWGGFTTQDLKRTQITARVTELVYNWWSLFVRLIECGATLLVNMRDIEPRKEDDGFDGAFLSP